MEALSRSYQVIRYDTRGFGRSRTEQTEFSNRQDILDLLSHLGVERAVLVGNSRGGIIAFLAASFWAYNPSFGIQQRKVAAPVTG